MLGGIDHMLTPETALRRTGEGQVFSAVVKELCQGAVNLIRVPGLEGWLCFQLQLPANLDPRRQQVTARVLGSLPLAWGSQLLASA